MGTIVAKTMENNLMKRIVVMTVLTVGFSLLGLNQVRFSGLFFALPLLAFDVATTRLEPRTTQAFDQYVERRESGG